MNKLQDMEMTLGNVMTSDAISKAKQSRSEKKARKAMLKLGLKMVPGEFACKGEELEYGQWFGLSAFVTEGCEIC